MEHMHTKSNKFSLGCLMSVDFYYAHHSEPPVTHSTTTKCVCFIVVAPKRIGDHVRRIKTAEKCASHKKDYAAFVFLHAFAVLSNGRRVRDNGKRHLENSFLSATTTTAT